MRLIGWMQPYDPAHAGRMLAVIFRVAVLASLGILAVGFAAGRRVPSDLLVLVVAAIMLGAAQQAPRWTDSHRRRWVVVPVGAILVLPVLDWLSLGDSVTVQMFFFFPVLYGASALRRPGALLVLGLSCAGAAALLVALLPWATAVTQLVYLAPALTATTLLLVRACERRDALVAQLTRQASVDPLTGLVTRRVLDQAAHAALSGLATGTGTALILLDVDDFKGINDAHGHLVGDDVLVQLAAVLTSTAGPDEVISRLGGDEIAILLPGASEAEMTRRGEDVVRHVRAAVVDLPDGQRLRVHVSAGMAHSPAHGRDLRELYAAADSGLYAAKRAGRDQVRPPPGSAATLLAPR